MKGILMASIAFFMYFMFSCQKMGISVEHT
jgi:hypothetical protein